MTAETVARSPTTKKRGAWRRTISGCWVRVVSDAQAELIAGRRGARHGLPGRYGVGILDLDDSFAVGACDNIGLPKGRGTEIAAYLNCRLLRRDQSFVLCEQVDPSPCRSARRPDSSSAISPPALVLTSGGGSRPTITPAATPLPTPPASPSATLSFMPTSSLRR